MVVTGFFKVISNASSESYNYHVDDLLGSVFGCRNV